MKIVNKRARFDYQILETLEAGLALSGSEAKALRTGGTNMSQSFARIVGGEAWLINVNIPIQGKKDYNPSRSRKLLLHKDQIISIQAKTKAKKLTLIPLSLYTKGRLYKVELALAKPKRKFEKKEALKLKDIKRDIEREIRG